MRYVCSVFVCSVFITVCSVSKPTKSLAFFKRLIFFDILLHCSSFCLFQLSLSSITIPRQIYFEKLLVP